MFEPRAAVRALGDFDGWKLARAIKGSQSLEVYTQMRDGCLGLKFIAEVDSSAAECIALVREVDILPTWNKFVDSAEILRLVTPTNLYACAVASFPWPIPWHSVVLHARFERSPEGGGGLLVLLHSPQHTELDKAGLRLPANMRSHNELEFQRGIARLSNLRGGAAPGGGSAGARGNSSKNSGRPRTRLELVLELDLRRLAFLGNAATSIPGWILNVVLAIVIPWVWKQALVVLRGMRSHTSPYMKRLAEDTSGIYEIVRGAVQQ